MQDMGEEERMRGFELTDGVKTSGAHETCQEYSGTLRRNSMRECREGGLNMNFMESYFCQVRAPAPTPSCPSQTHCCAPGSHTFPAGLWQASPSWASSLESLWLEMHSAAK